MKTQTIFKICIYVCMTLKNLLLHFQKHKSIITDHIAEDKEEVHVAWACYVSHCINMLWSCTHALIIHSVMIS